jgi:hypothetical protein
MPELRIRRTVDTVLGVLLNGFQSVLLEQYHEVGFHCISHTIHVAVGNHMVLI